MTKHKVIKKMGRFPDKIITKKKMKSANWKCSICKKHFDYNEPVVNPAPCTECESIFFETRSNK